MIGIPSSEARMLFAVAACFLLWASEVVGQEAAVDEKALRGKEIFERICSVCHGLDGEGQGELGFKLTSGQVVLWSDEALVEKIAYGNLTLGMPRFGEEFLDEGRMTDFGSFDEPPDIEAVVAYIRVIQRNAAESLLEVAATGAPAIPASADAGLGRALFMGKARCAECHSVSGEGGSFGPDLSQVAARSGTDTIYDAIVTPSKTVEADFRMKELTLGRGKRVRGRYRNETSASIEMFDRERNAWVTYDKKAVQFCRPLRTSPMPEGLLDALTEAEAGSLRAFLDSLK